MARSGALFAVAAIAAIVAFAARANQDGEVPMGTPDPEAPPIDDQSVYYPGDMDVSQYTVELIRAAVLHMLRSCEHTAEAVANETDYQTFYGGTQFWDMSDHPAITGELKPVQLSQTMCINAGFSDGICYSTAAGAYQITKPTWIDVRGSPGAADYLPDFTPESQDQAALRIIAKTGALPLIDGGHIREALPLLGKRWASIPGAIGKQGQRSVDFALAKFNEGLAA